MSVEMQKPVAIVLGGTRPHVALINNLKARGFFTILVDYYEDPPARAVADRHIRESTLDQDAVLEIARSENAFLVISACVDQANVTAAYVAEQLALSAPYSFETALCMSQKSLMKKIMRDNDIPTSPFRIIDRKEQLESLDLPFPLIVKPVDGNGSKGVRRADDSSQLLSAFREAMAVSRCGQVIVEGFCQGSDVSVDCFVKDGVANVLMHRRKYDLPASAETVINCYASLVPAQLSPQARKNIESIATKVAQAFGLNTTALLIQVMVDGDEVNVIELAPRIGGGMSYRTIPLGTGFDILDATVSSYLGESVAIHLELRRLVLLTTNVFARPGEFFEVTGYQDLLEKGVIDEYFQHKTRGMTIGSSLSSSDRACSFVIRAATIEDALERNALAMDGLSVVDEVGRDIMRRDIYLREDNV
ncbi:MAG: ATP-grasp domain-containing protein [Wenzhouxiangella sp.]